MAANTKFHIMLDTSIRPDIEKLLKTGRYNTITEILRAGIRELLYINFPNEPHAAALDKKSPRNFYTSMRPKDQATIQAPMDERPKTDKEILKTGSDQEKREAALKILDDLQKTITEPAPGLPGQIEHGGEGSNGGYYVDNDTYSDGTPKTPMNREEVEVAVECGIMSRYLGDRILAKTEAPS